MEARRKQLDKDVSQAFAFIQGDDGTIREAHLRHRTQRGMTIVELLIAMLVLAIGLGGVTILLTGAMASDNKNSRDTTATLLAQMVMEQISAQHVYITTPINITDCAGNSWTIATAPGAVGPGTARPIQWDHRLHTGLRQSLQHQLRNAIRGLLSRRRRANDI